MVAFCSETLNHGDGDGSRIDPTVWDKGSKHKVRRVESRVIEDSAGLPGPPGFRDKNWVSLDPGPVTCADVRLWPYSGTSLVNFTDFVPTLRWLEES